MPSPEIHHIIKLLIKCADVHKERDLSHIKARARVCVVLRANKCMILWLRHCCAHNA